MAKLLRRAVGDLLVVAADKLPLPLDWAVRLALLGYRISDLGPRGQAHP